ncbi:hypothetical protein [Halorussus amylolyticus]|nr:hypothetical protein [Halorussus amylolyticus]
MSFVVTLLWVGLVTVLWVAVTAGIWAVVYAGRRRRPNASGGAPNE